MPKRQVMFEYSLVRHIDGHETTIRLSITSDWIDNGIGNYEFWGMRGSQHAWMWEHNYEVLGHEPAHVSRQAVLSACDEWFADDVPMDELDKIAESKAPPLD